MSWKLSFCFLIALSLYSQTVRESEVPTTTSSKINDILLALKDPNVSRASLSQQLVDQMISLAEKGRQPPRPIVTAFADELTGALKGQKLDKSQITSVQQSIVEMMQEPVSSNLGTGVPPSGNTDRDWYRQF
jgi:hypothetical protein